MVTKEEATTFLLRFQQKITNSGYFLLKRAKNLETLIELNLDSSDIKQELLKLELKDYSQGPLPDELGAGMEMWVFGRIIKNKEVYIKVTEGRPDDRGLVISFHIAERSMRYPFRI